MNKIRLILPAFALLLTACAGTTTQAPVGTRSEIMAETARQQELVFEKMVKDQDRLFDIAFPLQTKNAEFCGKTSPMSGMTAWNLPGLSAKYRMAGQTLFGMDDNLTVHMVARKSPAEKAGIRKGDIILSVNGQEIPAGKDAGKIAERAFQSAGSRQSEVVVIHDNKPVSRVIQPVTGCDYPVLLNYSDSEVNAYADGEKIVVSKGIIRFAESDNEIAMVIAHELAHSALTHVDKMQQNATMGALGGYALDGIFAGFGVGTGGQFSSMGQQMAMQQYSIPFEQEADYVGMYFMARAGYPTNGIADFWRRMGAEGSASLTSRSTHPTSPERFIAIDRTHSEIIAKRRADQPLVPNMKVN